MGVCVQYETNPLAEFPRTAQDIWTDGQPNTAERLTDGETYRATP